MPPSLRGFRVGTEGVELGLPERLDFVEPAPECEERLGFELVDPDTLIALEGRLAHQAGLPQDAEVTAHRRRAHGQGVRELARALRAAAQPLDDAAARRIFRGLELAAPCEGHMVVPQATIGGAVVGPSESTAAAVSEAADFGSPCGTW